MTKNDRLTKYEAVDDFNWQTLQSLAKRYDPDLPRVLQSLIRSQTSIPELGLSTHVYARAKKTWLRSLFNT